MSEAAIIIMACIVLVVLWLFWIHIPANMARNRGRSALGWVLLTFIASPVWTIILLLIVGDSNKKISDEIYQQYRRDQR